MDDSVIGELWRAHCDGCERADFIIRDLIRKLVEERVEIRRLEHEAWAMYNKRHVYLLQTLADFGIDPATFDKP